jgi:uncharacterized protein (DUF1778 family)
MKETYIRVKMTTKQKEEMTAAAEHIGETLSSYVRRVMLLASRSAMKGVNK